MPDPHAPIPKQIRYIIGNEGCERFSFYGMRNILTVFLVSSLLLYLPEADRARAAKDVFHTFVIGVYFFPLLGGWLADRFFGKYNTIFWLSLVYCVGQACLAMFVTNRTGFYVGLGADRARLGRDQTVRGGIRRRSVRSDEQASREGRVRRVLLDHQLRLVLRLALDADLSAATRAGGRFRRSRACSCSSRPSILWLGRKQYVMVPPAPPNPHSFLRVSRDAIASGLRGQVLAAIAVASSDRIVPAHPEIRICHRRLSRAGRSDRVRRARRLAAARRRARQTSRRSDRGRALGLAGARSFRARHAVLVVVRPKSIDLGVAGKRDERSRAGFNLRRCRH